MNVESISPIGSEVTSQISKLSSHESIDFSDWLSGQIKEINTQSLETTAAVKQVVAGDIENLHQVIMQISKTQRSFEMAVQVRDRMLEGYQEIMRMQV